MSIELLNIVCMLAAVGCGLVAGVLLTFSDFVMSSLRATAPEIGVEAMQVINRQVYGSVFLALFFATAVLCILLGFGVVAGYGGVASSWLASGSVLYLLGVFLVTVVCNVPMNKQLDRLEPRRADARNYWTEYGRVWTRWNHLRTAASVGASICFLGALITLPI